MAWYPFIVVSNLILIKKKKEINPCLFQLSQKIIFDLKTCQVQVSLLENSEHHVALKMIFSYPVINVDLIPLC